MCGRLNSLIGLKRNLKVSDFYHRGKTCDELRHGVRRGGKNPNWFGMKRSEIGNIVHSQGIFTYSAHLTNVVISLILRVSMMT